MQSSQSMVFEFFKGEKNLSLVQKLIKCSRLDYCTANIVSLPTTFRMGVYFPFHALLMLDMATWLALANRMLVDAPGAGTSNMLDC